ncbi:hypothetical protein OFN94_33315, partial [Escherichia coli]|nr:hypothetical protein [Escherichia coli]
ELADDGSVQLCRYGADIEVVANFGETVYAYEETEIPAHSLLIRDNQETTLYIPQIANENQ